VKKSNYCKNLTFDGILNQHGHFKHTLPAQRCRDCGRWPPPCHTVPISHGSTAISINNSLAFLLDLYLYLPNIPRIFRYGPNPAEIEENHENPQRG
jgi:hypothetical protein